MTRRIPSNRADFTLISTTLVAVALGLSLAACDRSEPQSSDPQRYERTQRPPEGPDEIWQRHCRRCHTKRELEGRTADRITKALREEERMRSLEGQLSAADIRELAEMLAPSTPEPPVAAHEDLHSGAASDASPTTADGGASPQAVNQSAE